MGGPDILTRQYQRLRQFRSDLRDIDVLRMLMLPVALPVMFRSFVRDRTTLARAEEEIRRALAEREDRFLEIVRAQVYGRPASPYRRLLEMAGCDFSDLRAHTKRHGVERTLEQLAREGVYLTAGEFKGKTDVVRGGRSFRVSPRDFDAGRGALGFVSQSSGTSNRPIRSASSFDWLARESATVAVFLAAHDLLARCHAVYDVMVPGSGLMYLLTLARLGVAGDRWFARNAPFDTRLEAMYHHLIAAEIVLAGRWFGPGFPRPEFLDARDVVEWVAEKKRQGQTCCIRTVASNAVRIARVAWQRGTSLEGTTFIASGEPVTEAKRQTIERAGATTTVLYGYNPGPIHVGFGCANRCSTDEMHLNQHMLAVIAHPTPIGGDGPRIQPLLFTTLYASAPRFQLNVANGDYAVLADRACGCPLERVGFTVHLQGVRSYEKFTTEGMSYVHSDLLELVESRLPSEFGGGPGDYQLVEEEDADAQTRLTLLVHPDVGTLDEARLLSRLRDGLARGHRGNRFMTRIWHREGALRIRRARPYASPRGKISPLHIVR